MTQPTDNNNTTAFDTVFERHFDALLAGLKNPEAIDILLAERTTLYVINDIEKDTSPASVGGRTVDREGERE